MCEENKNNPDNSEMLNDSNGNEIGETNSSCPVTDNVENSTDPQSVSNISSELLSDSVDAPRERKRIRVSLTTLVCACVAVCLAAVMLTFTICSSVYQLKLAQAKHENTNAGTPTQTLGSFDELELLKQIFEAYSFQELNEEEILAEVLKAYVRATGDAYAEYYTDEEYKALMENMAGESQGIGINVINSKVEVGGNEYKALKVINVMKDSPAEKANVKFGDYIIAVGTEAENTTFNKLGYDKGLSMLQGVKGTLAEFISVRFVDEEYQTIAFSVMRDEFKTMSIMSTSIADPTDGSKIGIVKLIQFDSTTPTQFEEAVDSLRAQGCEKFVFDVRYNPGGELTSIVAVLSYFLDEGDTVISVKDNKGKGDVTYVTPVEYEDEMYSDVYKEDIGKYKDLIGRSVVLCNGNTASAAELFVANFRDHSLGTIVGETTYGKGSMQSYMSLSYFGYDGVLKMTRHMYYPPNGESYEGIGIEPNETVELSEEAKKYNIYDIFGNADIDNQLSKAINILNNNKD